MLLRAFPGIVTVFVIVALSVQPCAAEDDPKAGYGAADLVLLDGKVITVDPNDSIAEAIAIKSGRIMSVGHTADISRLIGEKTQIVRLGGKSVLPGFIDAHTHIEGIAAFHRMLDVHVPPLKGVDEILEKVPALPRSADAPTIAQFLIEE